jgi:hypothetical protein
LKTAYLYLLLFNLVLISTPAMQHNAGIPQRNAETQNKFLQAAASDDDVFPLRDNYIDTEAVATEPVHYKKPPRPLKVFNVYPNPANKIVYIRITGKQTVSLRNEEGRLIFKTAIREKAIINLTPLPPGVYFLTDERTGATKEFTIVR